MNTVENSPSGFSSQDRVFSSPSTQNPEPPTEKSDVSGSSGSLLTYTVIALGLALFVRFFVAAPYLVSGASMDPTFHDMHYLIIERITYTLDEPSRGDVVVFDLPGSDDKSLIKRVIGLPGETIELNGSSVVVHSDEYPDGFELTEPYLDPANLGGASESTVTLGPNEYFVLGDNRRLSSDSRIWGTLPRENIVGRALLRLYPFNAIEFFPGQARYNDGER